MLQLNWQNCSKFSRTASQHVQDAPCLNGVRELGNLRRKLNRWKLAMYMRTLLIQIYVYIYIYICIIYIYMYILCQVKNNNNRNQSSKGLNHQKRVGGVL